MKLKLLILTALVMTTVVGCTKNVNNGGTTSSELQKDVSTMTEAELYDYAMSGFNNEDFDSALSYFTILSDYKDSSNYVELSRLIIDIQGKWNVPADISDYYYKDYKEYPQNVTIKGLTLITDKQTYELRPIYRFAPYFSISPNDGTGNYYTFTRSNNELILADTLFKDGELMTPDDFGKVYYYPDGYLHNSKVDKHNIKIGMNVDDVLSSKWGKPDRINKTTTKYGTTEQWCYENNNYVYFTNGIVTSIQETK